LALYATKDSFLPPWNFRAFFGSSKNDSSSINLIVHSLGQKISAFGPTFLSVIFLPKRRENSTGGKYELPNYSIIYIGYRDVNRYYYYKIIIATNLIGYLKSQGFLVNPIRLCPYTVLYAQLYGLFQNPLISRRTVTFIYQHSTLLLLYCVRIFFSCCSFIYSKFCWQFLQQFHLLLGIFFD
jgi:hypothetical protein